MALSDKLIEVKNSLDCKFPWLLLLEFNVLGDDSEIIRVVKNTEDVVYKGNTYTAFNFSLSSIEQNIEGQITSVSLAVSGISHVLQPYVEMYEGCTSATIALTVIHADNLEEDYSELEQHFSVLSTRMTALDVQFTIGAPSPLKQRFPLYRFFSDICSYQTFKGPRCGYAGGESSCDRRFCTCRELGNSARFGGQPGLRSGGVRFV